VHLHRFFFVSLQNEKTILMKSETITLISSLKESFFAFVAIIAAFLAPIAPLLVVVGFTICMDTFFGIWSAKRQGIPITSKKMSMVISKMVLYNSAIILFFIIEKFIMMDFVMLFTSISLFLTKIVAIVLISIELKSMNESYQKITGISLWERFKALLKRTQEIKDDISEITKS
jgi:hypothetical protein